VGVVPRRKAARKESSFLKKSSKGLLIIKPSACPDRASQKFFTAFFQKSSPSFLDPQT
jgi:hypothetical protein